MPASNTNASVLHRAAWVCPVSSPSIPDGAVLAAAGGTIAGVGSFKDLAARRAPGVEIADHGDAALIPALVNAHTHLELTGMEGLVALPQPDFPGWLQALMPRRIALSPEAQVEAAVEGERRLVGGGTCLCGDITNGALLGRENGGHLPGRHTFLEVLGFNRESVSDALGPEAWAAFTAAASQDPSFSLAAHACYSVSASAIVSAKHWCRSNRRMFGIHAAEHPEEVRFLADGTGFCRELLESLGRWVDGWEPPRTTPVGYLDRLGALDANTLLVHAVCMTDADWEVVARRGSKVCFCPRGNRNTGVGRAAIGKALGLGVTVSLGTDSLASNTDLDLFTEAAFVLDSYPEISPRDVLAMITMGGARGLGWDARHGSLEPGRAAAMLAVELPSGAHARGIEETIVYQGAKGQWRWAA